MKPFVLLATRDHDKAARDEYESVRLHAGLAPDELVHLRVEAGPLPRLHLEDYSGVLLGGSPFNISDAVKSDLQLRIESDIRNVVDHIVAADFPFLGMCYGIGTVTVHLGGTVDRTYGEGLGAIEVRLTDEVAAYVVDLIRATRESADVETGASPRAGAMLALAARAHAALDGRDYVIPDDVKTLAAPALRHRVILSPAAEIEGRRVDQVLALLVDQVAAPR